MKKIISIALLAAAGALFAWAHAVLVPARLSLALLMYAASAVLLIVREATLCGPAPREKPHPGASLYGLIAVLITAVFFRFRYIHSVPIGFSNEMIGQFLTFSDKLLRDGFVYLPIWGYASTLHSYAVALVWKLFGQSFSAFRFYLACFGVLSAVTMYWWLRRLFGVREALIGGILLASSPYHQWAGRWGYNTAYLPLFVMLFFGALYILPQTKRKILSAILGGGAFVLGMHGHWGFALEVAAALIFILYCVLSERGYVKSNWLALAVMVMVIALLMAPFASYFLKSTDRSNYMTGTLGAGAGSLGAKSHVEKYLINLRTCYFSYSAAPRAPGYARHTPIATKAVLICGGIGLLLSLARFTRSRAHALLVILFFVHLAGIALTVSYHTYVFYLLIFWLAFAAITAAEVWRLLETLISSRYWSIAVCLLFLAITAACAAADYRYYFGRYMYQTAANPTMTRYAMLYVLDEMRRDAQEYDLYLPRREPGKDFDEEIFSVGDRLQNYKFLQSARVIRSNTVFFPGALSDNRKGVVAYLPPVPFWAYVGLERLKAVYPTMEIKTIMPPEPWLPRDKPMLLMLKIPAEDLREAGGLRLERDDEGGWAARGYFVAERAGLYSFECAGGCRVEAGGADATGPVILPQGAVEVVIRGEGRPEPGIRVSFKEPGGAAVEIEGRIFHVPPSAEGLIEPCLSSAAEASRFAYITDASYNLKKAGLGEIRDAITIDGTIYCTTGDGNLVKLGKDLSPEESFSLGRGSNYRFALSRTGDIWIFLKGAQTFFIVTDRRGPAHAVLGGAQAIQAVGFDEDNSLYAFSRDRVSIYSRGRWGAPALEMAMPELPPPGLDLQPWSMTTGPDGEIAVLDGNRQELIIVSGEEETVRRLVIPNLWWDSVVVSGPQGEWFIRTWAGGMISLDNQLRPLLNPRAGWDKSLFWHSARGGMQSVTSSYPIHSYPNGDISFVRYNTLYHMRRHALDRKTRKVNQKKKTPPAKAEKRSVQPPEVTAPTVTGKRDSTPTRVTDTRNVALNKSYTVNPEPNGFAEAYTTAATDGRKPISNDSCFGFHMKNTSLEVLIDIDLGRQERITGATLYTFFNSYNRETNVSKYGANYVEVYGSESGEFGGEQKLLGRAGREAGARGEPGRCAFKIRFDPHECRYVRFGVKKEFGEPASGTDWLFIKEAEVWKATN